jgi:hypothetical protein
VRVFVSSTYLDLAAHRAAVKEAIQRLGLEATAMETFGARPEEPVEACLNEVESCDLFVGVYAHRYGHIPAGSAISITEMEFHHAVSFGKPIFCFFVDSNHPWPPEMMDGEPGQGLLNAFRSHVSTVLVRDTFTTPDVLASRVATALGRFIIAQGSSKNNAFTTARLIQLTIADTAAMIFVDIMRLLCVAGSDLARTANAHRYQEFVDIADLHLSEFRAHLTRLTPTASSNIGGICLDVERRVAWVLTRLRRAPGLDRSWREYASIMRETADVVDALDTALGQEYYLQRAMETRDAVDHLVQSMFRGEIPPDANTFVRTRFSIQSMILVSIRESDPFAIATIRDDIDKRLAVPYFVIDRRLLNLTTTPGGKINFQCR